MFQIDKSAEFPYSPEQVFALMSDIRNEQTWLPTVKEVRKFGDQPVGVGTEFEALYQGFGKMRIRITEYAPPGVFACDVKGTPVDMRCRFEYSPIHGGTRMDAALEIVPHGALRLFQPVLKWMFNREFSKRPGQILHGLETLYPR